MIGMVREWVEWIGDRTGRTSIGKLSGTSGHESESVAGSKFIWKPSFCLRKKDSRAKTNRLVVVSGERTETRGHAATLLRELEKMKQRKNWRTDGDRD